MAQGESRLTVAIGPLAWDELRNVWRHNVRRYGVGHADSYREFLLNGIEGLAQDHDLGRPIEGRPELLGITLRRGRGDGHVVVYQVDPTLQEVRVLHIFHTKQDIEGRLRREPVVPVNPPAPPPRRLRKGLRAPWRPSSAPRIDSKPT